MHTRSFLAASALLLAALGCREDAESPTEPEAAPGPAVPGNYEEEEQELSFWQVSAGKGHTCGITTSSQAYCWGYNGSGALGNGTSDWTDPNNLRPIDVATTLRFRQIDAGDYGTCAVTTDDRVFCWGSFYTSSSTLPVQVGGNLRFRQVSASGEHACAIRYDDRRVYCWGWNAYGQLGDGTTTSRSTPRPVAGGRRFRQLTGGERHTCGLTTADEIFCWGSNRWGQVGDNSSPWVNVPQPSRIASSLHFSHVGAGTYHTCAVTTDSRAFCWGNGKSGQIGDGKTYLRFTPGAVAGGLLFRRLTGGRYHTCGETTTNRAYCWGSSSFGALGDRVVGASTSLKPAPVVGGLYFKQLSAGGLHTCGKTTASVGYCWGYNGWGRLGDGTTTDRASPTKVADAPIQ